MKIGDHCKLESGEVVEVTLLHSGYYDYAFTGQTVAGKLIYFDLEDVLEVV